jgi:hypothetical protein
MPDAASDERRVPPNRHGHLVSVLVGLLILVLPLVAMAEDGDRDAGTGWTFIVTPFVWLPETEGDITADGVSVATDMSFSDMLDQLNYGFLGLVEARNGRWTLIGEAFFANLEDDFDAGPLSIDLETDQLMAGGLLGYRILSRDVGAGFLEALGAERLGLFIDLLGGGRYWNFKQEIAVAGPGPGSSSDSSEHWFDLLVGTRLEVAFTDRFSLLTVIDVGGFGIGSASDSTWHWALTGSYRLGERWSVSAGYRVLSLDRADGSGADRVETNTKMFGPVLGFSYRF